MRTATMCGLGAAAALAAVAMALLLHAGAEEWMFAARWTARVSVLLFAIVFASAGLARLAGGGAHLLVRQRRGLGLAFAAAHFVHLAALSTWFAVSGQRPPIVTIVGGGLAYLLIAAMALTSTDAAQRRLGRWWKRLHLTGIWYVWLIFFQSYLGRVLEGGDRVPQGIYGLSLLLIALLLRSAPRFVGRTRSVFRV